MARYVMANRRAGKFTSAEKVASRVNLESAFSNFAAGSSLMPGYVPQRETDRRIMVFDADPEEISAKRGNLAQDVILEEEIPHYPAAYFRSKAKYKLLPALGGAGGPGGPGGLDSGLSITLKIQASGVPLQGAEVILFFTHPAYPDGLQDKQVSGPSGNVTFQFSPAHQLAGAVVLPAGGFWSVPVHNPTNGLTIELPALPRSGPLAWWHAAAGVGVFNPERGTGIRVGVIDTGVGPHPYLSHVTSVGSFIDGLFDAAGGADADSHGSHVCGIIGARPEGLDYGGIAPGVSLYSARVFPPGGFANQGDIAQAIDVLSKDYQVDLINLSLGSAEGSEIELDAIRDAYERGTVCVCAAGNEAGPVSYPARFTECLAVSAIGLEGWGPAGTLAGSRRPTNPGMFGSDGYYLSDFSCFGPSLDLAGPGVGIISTAPARFGLQAPYVSMDGTSMASPLACGAIAALLAADSSYGSLDRAVLRSKKAHALAASAAKNIGLNFNYQGHGMTRAL